MHYLIKLNIFVKKYFLPFAGQHRPAAIGGIAQTGMFLLELLRHPAINNQSVIVEKLLADIDVTQSFKKNAHVFLLGFQIGFAGMIDPSGRVAVLIGIDNVAVIQMKIEGVVRLAGIMRVKRLSFAPGDDFAFVFQHSVSRFDVTDSVDALAVDARLAYLRAAAAGRRLGRPGRFPEFILVLRQLIRASLYEVGVYINNDPAGQEDFEVVPVFSMMSFFHHNC